MSILCAVCFKECWHGNQPECVQKGAWVDWASEFESASIRCLLIHVNFIIKRTILFQDGPMVPGVPPREASDKLIIYQNIFDTLIRKYTTYTGGEELFGLQVTEYPRLLQIKKELVLLQKLYGLYNNVIDTVNGYYDIPWQDVNIDKINTELQEFQNRWVYLDGGTVFLFWVTVVFMF